MSTQDYNAFIGSELVSAYNTLVAQAEAAGLTGYRPVVRFADKMSAVKRCEALESSIRARKDGFKVKHDDNEQEFTKTEEPTQDEVQCADAVKPKKVRKAKGTKAKGTKAKTAKGTKATKTEHEGTNGHSGPRIGTKTAIVASLLTRMSGCTAREVLEATGWPAVSMPVMAKACGLVLRKHKEPGSPIQYFGD